MKKQRQFSYRPQLFIKNKSFYLQKNPNGIPCFIKEDSNAIEDILSTEIQSIEERHKLGAEIFYTMGTFAPAIGMLGTIIGLVQMLMQMEDPSKIGGPMAIALLTTFYGVLLANLLFLPIAGKLKTRSKQEILISEMVMEGIISIQSGDNPRIVEQKLKAFVSPKARKGE
jgi:chemotaxis protein MotA